MSDLDAMLIAEACGKSALIWLEYAGLDRARPARHVWHEEAAYILANGTEQPLPGLPELAEATPEAPAVVVSCRAKDSRALLVTWRAQAEVVRPYTPAWDVLVPLFRAARLNPPDVDDVPYVWASASALVKLSPVEIIDRPGAMPAAGAYASPPDSPATTRDRLPWVIHRRPVTRPNLS